LRILWLSKLHKWELLWLKATGNYHLFESSHLVVFKQNTPSEFSVNDDWVSNGYLAVLFLGNVKVGVVDICFLIPPALCVDWRDSIGLECDCVS